MQMLMASEWSKIGLRKQQLIIASYGLSLFQVLLNTDSWLGQNLLAHAKRAKKVAETRRISGENFFLLRALVGESQNPKP